MKDYEDVKDDVESLKENIHECYSEISKTSEQIQHTVRETYLTKSELETIQKDFQASITQNSSEIRMDFTKITNEIINNVSANQTLLEEYIRFKGALIELGKWAENCLYFQSDSRHNQCRNSKQTVSGQ